MWGKRGAVNVRKQDFLEAVAVWKIKHFDILGIAYVTADAVGGFEIPEITVYLGEKQQQTFVRQFSVRIERRNVCEIYLADEIVGPPVPVAVGIFGIRISRRKERRPQKCETFFPDCGFAIMYIGLSITVRFIHDGANLRSCLKFFLRKF